jgi:uncharacterized protein YjbI with pentapeptide repeats
VYCPIDKHIDIIKNNELNLLDNVFIGLDGAIYKMFADEVKKIYNSTTIIENEKQVETNENNSEIYYIYFDYETVIDWYAHNSMIPYSLSWFILSHKQVEQLTNVNLDNTDLTQYFSKSNTFNCIGWDCNEKFLKWILENQQNKIFRFVSFNGANFDNLILFSAILEEKRKNNTNFALLVSHKFT